MKKEIGKIVNYFSKISVAVIDLTDDLKVGSTITIEGATTSFEQSVDSMEIDRQKIETGKTGQQVALKVLQRVRNGDTVYLVTPE